MKLTRIFLFCLLFITVYSYQNLYAQSITNNTFGKGIKTIAKDSTFFMKFSTRMQNRLDANYVDQDKDRTNSRFFLRRARLKFDGFVFSPKVVYKIEYDIVNSIVLDAVVKWNFYKNLTLWYGQTKLPGNVERVISSQKLQFVDRSLLNSKYNIDRDKGFQLRHHFTLGQVLIREAISVSQGEGMNYRGTSLGNGYTGRVEILPFGKFTSKGDYFSSDLKREKTPKLMLAAGVDFNDEAEREQGQRGDFLSRNEDIESIIADLVFKYRGISVMAEYADRKVNDGRPDIFSEDGEFEGAFYTGTGLNTQLGYLFKNNFEIAGRYTEITPEKDTRNNDITQYTLALSKYIVGHSLKVQTDFSYTEEENKDDAYLYRLQVELSF